MESDELQARPSSPLAECLLPMSERENTARQLGLSSLEKTLYCWEYACDSIQLGVAKGNKCRKFNTVYSFLENPVGPSQTAGTNGATAPSAAHVSSAVATLTRPGTTGALQVLRPAQANALDSKAVAAALLARSSKYQTWWWHNAPDATPQDDLTEDDSPPASRHEHVETPHDIKHADAALVEGGGGAGVAAQRRVATKHVEGKTYTDDTANTSAASSQETVLSHSQRETKAALESIYAIALAVGTSIFTIPEQAPQPAAPPVVTARAVLFEQPTDDAALSALRPAVATVMPVLQNEEGRQKTAAVKETNVNKFDSLKATPATYTVMSVAVSASVSAAMPTTVTAAETAAPHRVPLSSEPSAE